MFFVNNSFDFFIILYYYLNKHSFKRISLRKEVSCHMIELSFYTILMAFLTSTVLFSLSCIFFSSSKRILNVGYKTIAFISFLSILRLVVPIDFDFTAILPMNELAKQISFFICQHRIAFFSIRLSIWDILLVIWLIGILFQLILYWRQYKQIDRIVIQTGKNVSYHSNYMKAFQSIQISYGISQQLPVYEIPMLSSPMLFSIRNPRILLPAENNYSDDDLYFIFRHEMTHFLHHDLLYKFFFQLLFIVYWWNPLKYILKRQVNNLLEINVDSSLTQNFEDAIPYMECLIKIKKQCAVSNKNYFDSCTLSISNIKEGSLEKRFQLLAHPSKQPRRFSGIFLLISIFVFLSSYFVTWEPLPVDNSSTMNEQDFILTEENAYAILNEDGTYDIYLYGEYLETVTSLKYYDSSLPVYMRDQYPQDQ